MFLPILTFYRKDIGTNMVAVPLVALKSLMHVNGNMTEANIVYSDVKFIKTKEGTTGESLQILFIFLLVVHFSST